MDSADISELIEENKTDQQEEEEVGDFQYDRTLYADEGVDEDVNFDWIINEINRNNEKIKYDTTFTI